MILPFIRLAITFRDIRYFVPMPEVRLLQHYRVLTSMPVAELAVLYVSWMLGGAVTLHPILS